jgi:hypothetical protein
VLARKAATIRRRRRWRAGSTGGLRTAKDARRGGTAKGTGERVIVADHVDPEGDESASELRSILDTELARLPEPFRLVVLLCELEGLSRHEASCRLGIPEGTLSSRLARAKAMLRDRLVRRGLFVTTASLTTALSYESQAAAVSLTLAESTTRAAVQAVAGTSLAGLVSDPVHSLTEEVLKAMLFAKLKGIRWGHDRRCDCHWAVLAQQPSPTPTLPQQVDIRLWPELVRSRPTLARGAEARPDSRGGWAECPKATTSSYSISAPDLMPTPAASVSTTRFTPTNPYSRHPPPPRAAWRQWSPLSRPIVCSPWSDAWPTWAAVARMEEAERHPCPVPPRLVLYQQERQRSQGRGKDSLTRPTTTAGEPGTENHGVAGEGAACTDPVVGSILRKAASRPSRCRPPLGFSSPSRGLSTCINGSSSPGY